ncbi:hypothetical protein SAMN05444414_11775 [Roseovarius marisflavi]|uniref:Uncharacterized protein n=1 Tax=Roseovarius marisflavi TaxID=1054996 RepID=A0A1M7BDG3_9RHOB|nr:hypothetical protein [Roseovarius marisflavi]SHL52964.1 hypothetical protein SAMN05444414_11775 [Roseovarius marisflavi]
MPKPSGEVPTRLISVFRRSSLAIIAGYVPALLPPEATSAVMKTMAMMIRTTTSGPPLPTEPCEDTVVAVRTCLALIRAFSAACAIPVTTRVEARMVEQSIFFMISPLESCPVAGKRK